MLLATEAPAITGVTRWGNWSVPGVARRGTPMIDDARRTSGRGPRSMKEKSDDPGRCGPLHETGSSGGLKVPHFKYGTPPA